MCGIAGTYNTKPDRSKVDQLIGVLQHRGPDDRGSASTGNAVLVHTRLSIIELSSLGAQPYSFMNLVVIYNGELYNYREVRDVLEKEGYSFDSNSDTEVLIKGFHRWGIACVDRFIGMFAFAIYDTNADELVLCRDRVGVKPLYYSYRDGRLSFASELKALMVLDLPRTIDPDAVSLYFRFGFIPHSMSIFDAASKLEPGHFLRVSRTGIVKERYWSVRFEEQVPDDENAVAEQLESLMISAFRYRMVSDVPVGVFLSGGIDSSLLCSILQKHAGKIHTFTIGFRERNFDESQYARKVAQALGTEHTEEILSLDRARSVLSDFYSIYDEPFADTSGIPTACVAKLAKDHGVKVVLSADGGDELFGGYSHYRKALRLYERIGAVPASLRKSLAKVTRFTLPQPVRKRMNFLNIEHRAYAFEELVASGDPAGFFEAFVANQSADEVSNLLRYRGKAGISPPQQGDDPFAMMMAWDFAYYLPDDLLVKIDRATMYHSIECREPFLDHRLVELAARIPASMKLRDGTGKYILRKLLTRYLPDIDFNRPKQGFSIPVFAWFRSDLDTMFDRYFDPSMTREVPFFNSAEITREHEKYRRYSKAGRQYNIEKMWRILSFMLWWEKYMKHGA